MSIEKNIFDPQVLLETLITELEDYKQQIKSLQKAVAKLRSDFVKSGTLKV